MNLNHAIVAPRGPEHDVSDPEEEPASDTSAPTTYVALEGEIDAQQVRCHDPVRKHFEPNLDVPAVEVDQRAGDLAERIGVDLQTRPDQIDGRLAVFPPAP